MRLIDVLAESSFCSRKARLTLVKYRRDLMTMVRHGIATDADVCSDSVMDFLESRSREVSPQNAQTTLLALLSVLTYLERHDRFPVETLRRVRRLRSPIPRPALLSAPHLTPADFASFVAVATGRLTRAGFLARVAVYSGLRASCAPGARRRRSRTGSSASRSGRRRG